MPRSEKLAQRKKPDGMQRLREQIPSMTNAELAILRGNAERLAKIVPEPTGERQKQVTTAWEVISLVDVEIGNRKTQKPPRSRV